MMKTIYVVRHGKASEGILGLTDKDRPLELRGILETRKLSENLIYKGVKPDLIVSSSAVRAHQTALEMAQVFGFPPQNIHKENILYAGDEDTIMDVLTGLPDAIDCVILVAHNPGTTEFVNLFLHQPMGAMAPSTIVELQFKMKNWQQLPTSHTTTTRIYQPDSLSM